MTKYLFLTAVVLCVSACSTLSKQAKEQLANKNYDEALVLYDRLVAEKPNEGEALEGQRKSREGVIDKNLIRVRLARIGQNYQESLDLLRSIVLKEREWNLYPSGAVAFTQLEETNEAKKIINQELYSILKEKKPLKVLYWVERYKLLFDEKFQVYLSNFKNSATQEGQIQCKAWTKTTNADAPFWSQFVKRFCTTMGLEQKIPTYDKKLYAKAELKLDKPTLPITLQQMIAADLSKAFKSTGWFDIASPRNMNLTLTSSYMFNESRSPQGQTHSYTVSVPFTEYVEREKVDAQGNKTKVSEPVTRYRDEQRFYNFVGTSVHQKVQFQTSLKSDVNHLTPINFNFDKTVQDFVHSENMPSIRLYPQPAINTKPEAFWLTQISAEYAAEFKKSIVTDFKSAFCNTLSESMVTNTLTDKSLLCLRETLNAVPDVVSRHFQNKFGLGVAETNTLVKLLD